MSRVLWTVAIPFNRSEAFVKETMMVKVALPPGSLMLELRYLEGTGPCLWYVGDMEEPCVNIDFVWVRPGRPAPPQYSFVGLVLVQGLSFGLFFTGNAQTSNKVRMP